MEFGRTGGNDADAVALDFDVHDEQQVTEPVDPITASRVSSLRDASVSTSNGSINTVAASSKRMLRIR